MAISKPYSITDVYTFPSTLRPESLEQRDVARTAFDLRLVYTSALVRAFGVVLFLSLVLHVIPAG